METSHSDQSIDDEPNAKRRKIETAVSTSSKPKTDCDCPILSLPTDILAKILAYIPVVQWPVLELMDENIRAATWVAWRQLRDVNVRYLTQKLENANDIPPISRKGTSVSILRKLAERSPFLKSLSGIDMNQYQTNLNRNSVRSLADFEHLQSISLGDSTQDLYGNQSRGIPFDAAVVFLETTRSRSSLKELQLYVEQLRDRVPTLDRFASSLISGREIKVPLKLEKFVLSINHHQLGFIRLDTIDTSRLTDLRLGQTSIEPEHLTNFIGRASSLRRIEFSFLSCCYTIQCNSPRLEANKKLLTALSSHENLTAMKFDCRGNHDTRCMNFAPEFIEMLKTIGRRGQLRKLALEVSFVFASAIEMNEICATICHHIPYLQSIKLFLRNVSDESVVHIVSLADLEEIHLMHYWHIETASTIVKMAQLPHLKRLALDYFSLRDTNWLTHLAGAPALMDLRILCGNMISTEVIKSWTDGFGCNLRRLMLRGIGKHDAHFENEFVRLLEKAVGLRVLILEGRITDQTLTAIAKSCSQLETLGVQSTPNQITVQHLQEVIDRCPKLKRLDGIGDDIRKNLQIPKYRKIGDVDVTFWTYDFDADLYD